MQIKPKRDNVLIKVFTEEEKVTKTGIVLVENQQSKESPDRGIVVSVGEGRHAVDGTKIPPTVKEMDKIIFHRYAGTKIKIEDEEFLMIKENDILAVIEE